METLVGLFGYVGVGLLLLTYFMLVIGHMKATDTQYLTLNIIGAVLLVIAIHTGGTVPWLHTAVIWLLVSLVGFYKHHMVTTTAH